MELGLTLGSRRLLLSLKALPLARVSRSGGWFSVVREPTIGAWQRNEDLALDTVTTYSAVFACTTLVMSDVGKLALRLVQKTPAGVWEETESPAFSPVLRKPNHYQTTQQFVESWMASKLTWGNTYVFKVRDARGVVVQLYVLDPSRVAVLVSPSGEVFYECRRDDLSGIDLATIAREGINPEAIVIPAREIIHDRMNCLFHPLVGLSPLYAAGVAASGGLAIQGNSKKFFSNVSNPSGILIAPNEISDEQALTLKERWQASVGGDKLGAVALLSGGLKYEKITINPGDAQLIEQADWTAKTVCGPYHVPPYLVDIGPPPPYANIEPVIQKYFSQCLQTLIKAFEDTLDEGLGLTARINGVQYGTEFDLADLIWLDYAARNKAASDGIGSGGMSPNEARQRFYGLGPVEGGETPYMQQQNYSLSALAARDREQPLSQPQPPPPPTEESEEEEDMQGAALSTEELVLRSAALFRQAWA